MGRDVLTPCPISQPRAPITMRPSGSMRMKAPSASPAAAVSCPAAPERSASSSPPAALSDTPRKARRESARVSATALIGACGHPSALAPRLSRSEEHTSELQSLAYLVCRLLLEKKNYAA